MQMRALLVEGVHPVAAELLTAAEVAVDAVSLREAVTAHLGAARGAPEPRPR